MALPFWAFVIVMVHISVGRLGDARFGRVGENLILFGLA
jgi:hypothetical protein